MLLVLLSVVLFYFSFPNVFSIYGFWPCIWLFAVPLLVALRGQSWPQRLQLGLVFSLLSYGLLCQWVWPLSRPGFVGMVLLLGLQPLLFCCLCVPAGVLETIYYPLLWAGTEALRNHWLGGFSFFISQAQAFCPSMLKLYGLIGCTGMSFVILLSGTCLYKSITQKQRRWVYALGAALVFLGVAAVGWFGPKDTMAQGTHLRIGVIQANISPRSKMDLALFDRHVMTYLGLTVQCFLKGHPDLIVWPETAFPDDLLHDAKWRPRICGLMAHMTTDLLTGIAPIIDGKSYNSAVLINAQGQLGGLYNKQALVPFAEYAPLARWGVPWARYQFTAGRRAHIFKLSRKAGHFGVLICSESAYPGLARRLKTAGADFFVEISNDGWFTQAQGNMLHAQMAVMRAVENHVWMVRAANTGWSFAVSPQGIIHTARNLKLGQKGFGLFDIIISGHHDEK